MPDDAGLSECRGNLSSIVDALTGSCRTSQERNSCLESAIDVLRLGSDLIEASQIPQDHPDAQFVFDLSKKGSNFSTDHRGTYYLVAKLKFLKSWFVKLATPRRETILWSGFWTDPDAEAGAAARTSKERLFQFADMTEHDTLHPSTELGRLMEQHQQLRACYMSKNDMGLRMANNMWAFVSFAFVLGMREQGQGTVVVLVNKKLDGERPLRDAVVYRFEVPTLGIAAFGMGFWSPHILLIDMMGTCAEISPALREKFLEGATSWYFSAATSAADRHWSARDFSHRSGRITWECLNCPDDPGYACNLDERLAQAVQKFRQERGQSDKNCNAAIAAVVLSRRFLQENGTPGPFLKDIVWTEPSTKCQDARGNTPLHFAARVGDEDVVRMLLEKKGDPNAKNMGGITPLHQATETDRIEVARMLLAKDADPNAKTAISIAPLHLAATQSNVNILRLLLQKRADLNAKGHAGTTALHSASLQGSEDVVRLLLENQADPNVKKSLSETPLEGAVEQGHEEVVRMLLEQNADPNAEGDHGVRPLHMAALRGNEQIARMLLEKKADPKVKDDRSSTPLQQAAEEGHQQLVHLLRSFGAPG